MPPKYAERPRLLKGEKGEVEESISPTALSQEDWDVIHGKDPMSIFGVRGQHNIIPDHVDRRKYQVTGASGPIYEAVDLFEPCKHCSAQRGWNHGGKIVCLGCYRTVCRNETFDKRSIAEKKKVEDDKKAGEEKKLAPVPEKK